MKFNSPMTRRESIQKMLRISGGIALAGAAVWMPSRYARAAQNSGFLVEGIGEAKGYSIDTLTRNVFDAAGGISRFISKGDVVVIKPNLSWARKPEFGATTHPEVLEAVIELCREAGAKKVRIADNTIQDARKCFSLSGAVTIAKKTGADLVFPRSSLMKGMKISGNLIDGEWPVFVPLVEADKIINLPVAKTHSACRLTLGMKNWIGGVDGNRGKLHQNLHETIVDLARFFTPAVTLIDAIRIMTRNGPTGGSRSDVVQKNTLILSDDPVAADAAAARLFGFKPEDIGFIRLGQKQGLGTYDSEIRAHKKVVL